MWVKMSSELSFLWDIPFCSEICQKYLSHANLPERCTYLKELSNISETSGLGIDFWLLRIVNSWLSTTKAITEKMHWHLCRQACFAMRNALHAKSRQVTSWLQPCWSGGSFMRNLACCDLSCFTVIGEWCRVLEKEIATHRSSLVSW